MYALVFIIYQQSYLNYNIWQEWLCQVWWSVYYKRTVRETLHLSFKHKVDFCMIGTSEIIFSTRLTGDNIQWSQMTKTQWLLLCAAVSQRAVYFCSVHKRCLRKASSLMLYCNLQMWHFQSSSHPSWKILSWGQKLLNPPGNHAFNTFCRSDQWLQTGPNPAI